MKIFRQDVNVPKATVILNPTAGRGAGARLSPQICDWLHSSALDFELEVTSSPSHATTLAYQAATQGREMVVAVGGDGTANEVLNGLMQAKCEPDCTAMGVLPIGTGNDFAFGAGIPLDLRAACQLVAQGQSRMIDVGWMHADNEEPRYFGNGVGVGFDAMANIESRKVKRLRGSLLYLVAVLRTLAFYYQAPQTTIDIDDLQLDQPSLMISVMNGQRMGGAFFMTPGSRIDDGLLDLCVAAKVSRGKMVAFVPRFMRGTHTTDPDITMSQGQSITVLSETPWAAQIDGEIYGIGAQRFEIALLPRRMRLICGPARP